MRHSVYASVQWPNTNGVAPFQKSLDVYAMVSVHSYLELNLLVLVDE